MKNILVTGGAGYIGSKVSYDLIDEGYRIIIIDNLSSGKKKLIPGKAIFKKIDITNIKSLEKIFKKYRFNSVFHFAAKKKVDESQKYPLKYFKTNVIGTKNLLDLIIKYKVKNLIFSSSCSVYGNVLGYKVAEKNFLLPLSCYGYTKLISENTIAEYKKKFNFNYAILRYFNVIGADHKLRTGEINPGSLFKNLVFSIKRKKKIQIFGDNYNTKDGTCIRDYIDINDLSKLHILAMKKIINFKKSILFNCGYSKPISVYDIIKNFEKILKYKIKIKIKNRRPGDVEKIFSNNNMQKKLFPRWKQKYDLSHSIISTLKWDKVKF